jgi:hypothetical protein
MFQRIARNYIKDGYFPTDGDTTERILSALVPSSHAGNIRIIDPCAGEGTALAECKHQLGIDRVEAFAVEYDLERSAQAKKLVDRCIHGDFFDQIISRRSFGMLWLNPPYGDLVADRGHTAETGKSGLQRLEKKFFQHAIQLLQFGGVLVLIVPYYVLDDELQRWLAGHLDRISVFLAPEQQFKQAVVMGVKKRVENIGGLNENNLKVLNAFTDSPNKPTLPKCWGVEPYTVPVSQASDSFKFHCAHLDISQLAEETVRFPCLWPQFETHFSSFNHDVRQPLMALSEWHLALVLAAGQVAGVVTDNDGIRKLVVKGNTFKDRKETVEEVDNGNKTTEVRTVIDKFVPVIKALDFTEGSPTFGKVITIK